MFCYIPIFWTFEKTFYNAQWRERGTRVPPRYNPQIPTIPTEAVVPSYGSEAAFII